MRKGPRLLPGALVVRVRLLVVAGLPGEGLTSGQALGEVVVGHADREAVGVDLVGAPDLGRRRGVDQASGPVVGIAGQGAVVDHPGTGADVVGRVSREAGAGVKAGRGDGAAGDGQVDVGVKAGAGGGAVQLDGGGQGAGVGDGDAAGVVVARLEGGHAEHGAVGVVVVDDDRPGGEGVA